MARILPLLCTTAALTAAAATAHAQSHPVFLPTRDVAVTYQLSGGPGGQGQVTHLYYSAARSRLRIDTPNNAGFTVLDRGAGQRMMVMNQERSYVAVPLDPGTEEGFVLNSSMHYVRQGQDSVAGIPCTVWSVSSPQATGTACVTADGVLLRGDGTAQNGGRTTLVASDVRYDYQPPDLFEPPQGYQKMDAQRVQQGEQGGAAGPPPNGQ